jgi:hypothetical protein
MFSLHASRGSDYIQEKHDIEIDEFTYMYKWISPRGGICQAFWLGCVFGMLECNLGEMRISTLLSFDLVDVVYNICCD